MLICRMLLRENPDNGIPEKPQDPTGHDLKPVRGNNELKMVHGVT